MSSEKKDFPPQPRIHREERKLSLKLAIAAATRRESADVKSGLNTHDEFPRFKSQSGRQQEMGAHLLELQADIINREGLLAEKEKYLEARALELNEKEALLQAHKKVLESRGVGPKEKTQSEVSSAEMDALKALKAELEAQEASLQDREVYIEQCENDLVEKSMQLTEREAHIEQREEDSYDEGK